MNPVFPSKLRPGDKVRVVAPARSLGIVSVESRQIANQRFAELGLQVTFGKHVEERDDFNSSSVASRIKDLHDAFADTSIKGIFTAIGGFNSNQLLREIDWDLIDSNPKIFCGFSDITALNNAILAKTGLVTYSGPHYSSFGMQKHFEYTLDYMKRCLLGDGPITIQPSTEWTDDAWFADQENRQPIMNNGWLTLQDGQARGLLWGGNLSTINLLQGTQYLPSLKDTVMFIENDEELQPHHFDRMLTSLVQQSAFAGVKGLLIGRFQRASNMNDDLLKQIVQTKKELAGLPIIANVDFGHTSPILTLPVGGTVEINANAAAPKVTIEKH